jgi:flagellar basal body-associated protein FliL
MAKKKKDDTPAAEGEEGAKKKKPPIMVIGLCVALAGVGYMLGGRSAGATPAAGTETTTTVKQLEGCAEGVVAVPGTHNAIDLPAMNINLTDGHYLRVTVSLGLCPDVVLASPEEFVSAPAKDILVNTLSGNSMAALEEPEGREKIKELLTKKISDAYPEEVYEVYFLEFVMQ